MLRAGQPTHAGDQHRAVPAPADPALGQRLHPAGPLRAGCDRDGVEVEPRPDRAQHPVDLGPGADRQQNAGAPGLIFVSGQPVVAEHRHVDAVVAQPTPPQRLRDAQRLNAMPGHRLAAQTGQAAGDLEARPAAYELVVPLADHPVHHETPQPAQRRQGGPEQQPGVAEHHARPAWVERDHYRDHHRGGHREQQKLVREQGADHQPPRRHPHEHLVAGGEVVEHPSGALPGHLGRPLAVRPGEQVVAHRRRPRPRQVPHAVAALGADVDGHLGQAQQSGREGFGDVDRLNAVEPNAFGRLGEHAPLEPQLAVIDHERGGPPVEVGDHQQRHQYRADTTGHPGQRRQAQPLGPTQQVAADRPGHGQHQHPGPHQRGERVRLLDQRGGRRRGSHRYVGRLSVRPGPIDAVLGTGWLANPEGLRLHRP